MAGMSPKKPCLPSSFKPLNNHPSSTNNKEMIEQAKQELKLLEAQHPTRFHYLKLQLKEFIHLHDQEDEQPFKHKQQHQFLQSIITQESSSSKKRQREEEKDDGYSKPKTKIRRRKNGIRDAVRKAEACLHKIQTLKSFFSSNFSH